MQPQPARQPTVKDILDDLPKIREIAARPAAQNQMLAALLQQAAALEQIAVWTVDAERVVAQQDVPPPPFAEAPATEASNGHTEDAIVGEVVEMVPGRKKGGGT